MTPSLGREIIKHEEKSPKNEIKRDRFKHLAQARTNRVLKTLKILGNCADKSRYEYKYIKEDVGRVFAAVDRRLKKTKARFDLPIDKKNANFDFL